MFPRFTVLASGSSGNSSLLEVDGFGLLLDIGLGPRQLASRLITSGRSWQNVQAVLADAHTWRPLEFPHAGRAAGQTNSALLPR